MQEEKHSVLITAASGLLGSNLVLEALGRKMTIVALSNRHRVKFPGIVSVNLDLTSTDVPSDIVREASPSWIIHCAALTDVDRCEELSEQAYMHNVVMTSRLSTIAASMGIGLAYISTDSVFDGVTGGYSETSTTNPLRASSWERRSYQNV